MNFPIKTYFIQGFHGLVYGMLIFLIASGLTIVFGMMGVLNFAHTSFYMIGAFITYTVTVHLGNFWLSLAISPKVVRPQLGMKVKYGPNPYYNGSIDPNVKFCWEASEPPMVFPAEKCTQPATPDYNPRCK